MIYDKPPKVICNKTAIVTEFFNYLYLPIKLIGNTSLTIEPRLQPLESLIGTACCDFVGTFGLDRYTDSYVYVTAKNEYQAPGQSFNRMGWHSDGFGSDDISYIWSNKQPTIFSRTRFDLSSDDMFSMIEMEQQAIEGDNYTLPNNSLIRMDQFTIHKVGPPEEGVRCFLKVVISKDQFRLAGNSVNYLLDYKWAYVPRKVGRNIPAV
jgi:hypothetical protein